MITGLHPGNTLLGQETREEKVLGRLWAATKAQRFKVIAERNEPIGRVGDPMCYPPVEIGDLPIERHNVKTTPR